MSHTPRSITPLLLLAILAPKLVLGQSDEVLPELAACLDIEQERERLICLEAIVVRESASIDPSTDPARAPSSEEASTSVESASVARIVSDPGHDSDRAPADNGTRSITIVEIYELARGNMRFLTDDGRAFVQYYGPLSARYPPVPFSAEIVDATMGSFFLRVEDGPRGVRVRRETN